MMMASAALVLSAATTTSNTADTTETDPTSDKTSQSSAKTSEECSNANANDQTCTSEQQQSQELQFNSSGERLIAQAELSYHGIKSTESKEAATAGGHTIWLSILGRVYDVTSGGPSYYGPNGSYNFYSGRDASPCFHSGKNNEEGANDPIETWTDDKHLMSVYDWSLFYEKHETYTFQGVLINSKYYNELGEETEIRKDIVDRAKKVKVVVEKEREERKKARMEKRKLDREKNNNKK